MKFIKSFLLMAMVLISFDICAKIKYITIKNLIKEKNKPAELFSAFSLTTYDQDVVFCIDRPVLPGEEFTFDVTKLSGIIFPVMTDNKMKQQDLINTLGTPELNLDTDQNNKIFITIYSPYNINIQFVNVE
ncbi:MAG: hypothetical protein HRT87_08505 [Legionellales bacterium]|nr:hypothetical protein [Legionellales bacterium]